MYYRSDWPEIGLSAPVIEESALLDFQAWQGGGDHNKWRWVCKLDDFESRLYGIAIWNLHLEILDSGQGWLTRGLNSPGLSDRMQEMLQQLLERTPWSHAYVATKVVRDESLYQVLINAGFEQVEHRCLYTSNVSNLQISRSNLDSAVHFQSLAAIAANQHDRVREQILETCNECFQRGFSRHFADGFLLQRAPGSTYILDVMKLNFERIPAHLFLLALDANSGHLCGFSILSKRPGLVKPYYTQLLSAVRIKYRGKGVYAGLTRLLTETLPHESQLLNISHADNYAMRRAYQNTGRLHVADTLVLRRIFDS